MNRLENIISLVSQYQKIDVNTLSELLQVSKVTIRKDLDKLEGKGLLHREHGYAVLNSGDDLNVRLSFNHKTKKEIAALAANMVSDNDTILIESGSTCALLAENICQTKRNVTILTNSCFIANYLGEYQSSSQVTVGPLLKKMISLFHVSLAFVGTDGFDPKLGFMGRDLMRSEVAQEMANAADEVIILTDSSKFNQTALVEQLPLSTVSQVITDKHPNSEIANLFQEAEITIQSLLQVP